MKFFSYLVFALIVFSCSENERPKPATIDKKDSASFVKNDVANPYAPVDLSPIDISYWPANYPILKMSNNGLDLPIARVIYGRPHRQGRDIFGTLLKYGEPWRLGANEGTEIEFFKDVSIQDKKISKGRYLLYCIPQADNWTIIFNSNIYSWGLHADSRYDLHRFQIPVQKTNSRIEYFTMIFEEKESTANLVMVWDNVIARLPISSVK